jgi:aconitase A
MKEDFQKCLVSPIGFKGYAVPADRLETAVPFLFEGQEFVLRHGSVLIAAITSCTNTSNPRYPWMRSSQLWMRSSQVWMRSSQVWMRSSQVVDEI